MAQATPVDLGRTPPYTPPATITKVDLGSKAPVSQHRALAAAGEAADLGTDRQLGPAAGGAHQAPVPAR